MSTFIGVIVGGGGGYLLCLLVTRIRQEEIRHDRGLIRRWMDSNDAWAIAQAELFAAEQPHVTGELVAVQDTPALSAESHEDEQAPAEDDDHAGAWWLPVMTLPLLLARLWAELVERVRDAVESARESWRTRNEVGSGDGITEVLAASGYDVRTDEEIAAEIAELTGEPVRPVAAIIDAHRRKTLYLPTGAQPMVRVTGAEGGRHRAAEDEAEPVEAVA